MAVSFEEMLQTKLNEIVASVQQEEKRLKAIGADLESKRAQLEEERAAFEAEKEMFAAANQASNSKVKLDVGSTTYHASRTTLTSMPGSMREAMYSGHHKLDEDEDGRAQGMLKEVTLSASLSTAALDEEDKEGKEGKWDKNKEDAEENAASVDDRCRGPDCAEPAASCSSESSLSAPQLQGVDSSKYSGVSVVDQHQELISPSPSAGQARARLPIGLLFPDAGAVHATMMSGVKEIPAVTDMLKKAAPILGFDLLRLCLEGPQHKLREWVNAQCASYVACLAGLEKLRNEREEAVTGTKAMAGMTTGEIVALKAAGVFTFEDGLKLVKLYGEAIKEVALVSGQAELSVVGLSKPKLAELCAEAAKNEGAHAVCQINHEFSPLCFCTAGTVQSMLELKDLAEKAGALQTQRVSDVAYHTRFMKPAEAKVSAFLDGVLPNMRPPRTTVYMNATGAPVRPGTNPKDIAEVLKKNLTSPVLWGASVHGMIEEGISEFYNVGPASTLKDLMRHQSPKIWRRAMTNINV